MRQIVLFTLLFSVALSNSPLRGDAKDSPAPKYKESPELIEKGKKAYLLYCVACHGENLDGKGPAGAAIKPRNFLTDTFKNGDTPEAIEKTIREGIPNTLMVPFSSMPEEDRWGIVYYIKSMIAKAKLPK